MISYHQKIIHLHHSIMYLKYFLSLILHNSRSPPSWRIVSPLRGVGHPVSLANLVNTTPITEGFIEGYDI